MIKLKNYFLGLYRTILSSIAFYPAIITAGFLTLALLVLTVENYGISDYLLEYAPFLVINNADTARTILSTFIGGLISLTVFSFSMVMVILSQASSNFSPRLLPELISNKRHQIVLGFYLGTIVYSILIVISILPDGDEYTLPGFGILLGIVFGISCMGMFVYFIHSISQEIQINFILERIFNRTKARIQLLDENEHHNRDIEQPDTEDWHKIYGTENGYFQGVTYETLLELGKELDTVFEVLPFKGMFLLKSIPILKAKDELNQEQQEQALSCMQYSSNPTVGENYVIGVKQITEIAVKAMSPGINDPGTAINAIDYLTEILALRMKLADKEIYTDDEEQLRLIQTTVNFDKLLYTMLASLRQYSKHDVIIIQKLLLMLQHLIKEDSSFETYKEDIRKERNILMEDAKLFIKNEADLKVLEQLSDSIE